jgi:hypothetical protein
MMPMGIHWPHHGKIIVVTASQRSVDPLDAPKLIDRVIDGFHLT